MKRIHYYIMPMLAAGLLAGCSSARKAITATPSPCTVTPDSANMVRLDVEFNVPEHYLSKRSRLFITPTLVAGDTLLDEYDPIVMDAPIYGKKTRRKTVLHGYVDPYGDRAVAVDDASRSFTVPYDREVRLPEGIDNGRIVAVVSTDGCGQCTGIDTIEVASISVPVNLIDEKESLHLSWIEPEFVVRPKVAQGKGVANLQFVINRHDINLGMGNNRSELENMVATLAPILEDSLATLTSLDIYGMASADGPLSFNTPLSRNRANSAKNWLVEKLEIPADVQRGITVGSRPEGWQPVLDAMLADGHPGAEDVRRILERYADENDDVAERYIRRLPCWKDIRAKYLQKDRKVEYVYTYTIKSFTDDAELIDMYRKRPDAFNEEEFLRVSELATDDVSRMEVYKTLLKYFPQSKVGANNLAVLYLRAGNEEEARRVLAEAGEYTPEMLNTLAASYVYDNDYERAIELLQDVDLPEARYNLGILKAKQRKLAEAYEILRPFADVNSAICALSVNRNGEAKIIMAQVADEKPLSEYVRSMTAARLGEEGAFRSHIGKACGDEKLRNRAKTEPDFRRYINDPEFREIIYKEGGTVR